MPCQVLVVTLQHTALWVTVCKVHWSDAYCGSFYIILHTTFWSNQYVLLVQCAVLKTATVFPSLIVCLSVLSLFLCPAVLSLFWLLSSCHSRLWFISGFRIPFLVFWTAFCCSHGYYFLLPVSAFMHWSSLFCSSSFVLMSLLWVLF